MASIVRRNEKESRELTPRRGYLDSELLNLTVPKRPEVKARRITLGQQLPAGDGGGRSGQQKS